MAKITPEMSEFVEKERCLVATADRKGQPNIAVKGSTMVIDEETLAFGEIEGGKTYQNIIENPQVMVIAVNLNDRTGYRFLGRCELISNGPLFEKFADFFAGMGRPSPVAVVQVKVNEIIDLWGKKLR
ncbi:MAG: pyridoxamine 5'-phosphate oxidase family protein [Desulfosporosinus sp.]